jgi:hypothetical protein
MARGAAARRGAARAGGTPAEGEAPPARLARWGPPAVLVLAVAVGLLAWAGRGEDRGDEGVAERAPVAVTSDAPRHAALAELVAASELVVRAEVTATERGRVFGDPRSDGAIESRLVHLEVTSVLHGHGPAPGDLLLVEEEGWTADGAPLVVDGLAPSATGDDGIWFLQRVGQDEDARYVVVGAEGRYLVDGERLTAAAGDDPLVAAAVALGPRALADAIRAVPPTTTP